MKQDGSNSSLSPWGDTALRLNIHQYQFERRSGNQDHHLCFVDCSDCNNPEMKNQRRNVHISYDSACNPF